MYKRPRMDDPYGGPPMMGYGDMYGGPMGMGAMGGDMFPCCKLRGLPFDVSDHDIKMFLVRVVRGGGGGGAGRCRADGAGRWW